MLELITAQQHHVCYTAITSIAFGLLAKRHGVMRQAGRLVSFSFS